MLEEYLYENYNCHKCGRCSELCNCNKTEEFQKEVVKDLNTTYEYIANSQKANKEQIKTQIRFKEGL